MPLPLFSVTGPSAAGKSTVCAELPALLPECVPLDGDLLWRSELWDDVSWFYSTWLSVAGQVSRAGRPAVLCTAAMPEAWEDSRAREQVGEIHMLALVCNEEVLRDRLLARGAQDPNAPETFLDDTLNFNRVLRERLPFLDTTDAAPAETAQAVAAWVREQL
jgi:broad-specificity NMP kinase